MKKIFIKLVLLLLCTVVFTACELQSEVYDQINADIYPSTARDASDLVTDAAYSPFTNYDYSGMFNVATGYILTVDMSSDHYLCSWGDNCWPFMNFARFSKSETRNITRAWGYLNSISKMTMAIDRIQGIDMDEKLKKQYIAELRCGRGFMAFLIYDLYGPIIVADLETLQHPLEQKILPRLSDEESQKYIVDELTAAAADLPYNYIRSDADYGRFTKGLCHTLLMKFYMQQKQWDNAIAEGRELQKSEYGYALVTEGTATLSAYANIFTEANEKNAETIWAINDLEGTQTHLWYPHSLPNNLGHFDNGRGDIIEGIDWGWGGYKLTWDFYHTFEDGDQRKETIIAEYTTTGGTVYNEANKGAKEPNSLYDGVFCEKYHVEPNVGDACQTDWIVYRYADVLTLLSEALVRKSGVVTQEAVDLLNQVRTRAGLPSYTISSFTDSRDFLDKLLMERAHELYWEGCRRQDLIRDGSYIEKMLAKCRAYGEPEIADEHMLLFPLPESAITEGKGIITQNPGY
jgi:hypothetical protein